MLRVSTVHRPPAGPVAGELPATLRRWVEGFSVPRHRLAQPEVNRQTAAQLGERLRALGYEVTQQGDLDNVVAWPPGHDGSLTWVGTHYDSCPGTPGADDNASGMAVLLEAARLTAEQGTPVGLVAFNGEEDGLLGSIDFVREGTYLPRVKAIHVLEMVGFTSTAPQRYPLPFLPGAPKTGDFIGLVADHRSARLANHVIRVGRALDDGPSVAALKTYFGLHHAVPDLERSDHAPFWHVGIPALMWTDTSEFRNPHYHAATDTPDTLDYDFMARVTRLLVAAVS